MLRITKYAHSCIRLESNGCALVIDPGVGTEPEALDGVDAVFVTHEHRDHADDLRLADLDVAVHAPTGSDINVDRLVRIDAGAMIEIAGFEVRAVGGFHARVVDAQIPCANLGYIVNGLLYHPGDAFHVPDRPIDTLLVPLQASWLKVSDCINFVRHVAPRQAVGIHDGQLTERGICNIMYLGY